MSKPHLSNQARRAFSLFERLSLESEDVRLEEIADKTPLHQKVGSIKRNLVQLLNARSGATLSNYDFGLKDFNDCAMGSADMLREVTQNVRNVIVEYEPRLGNVEVNIGHEAVSNAIHLQVTAVVTLANDDAESVELSLALIDGRHFKVFDQ